jgi:hypothetical protein
MTSLTAIHGAAYDAIAPSARELALARLGSSPPLGDM